MPSFSTQHRLHRAVIHSAHFIYPLMLFSCCYQTASQSEVQCILSGSKPPLHRRGGLEERSHALLPLCILALVVFVLCYYKLGWPFLFPAESSTSFADDVSASSISKASYAKSPGFACSMFLPNSVWNYQYSLRHKTTGTGFSFYHFW